ncbi:MAG: molybdate ABC transporter substrate-binding protein [Opitutaceae bacterium]|nr:molybdate ABC transporter substrate-binding protein [Opitutaceae bacterium]
MKSHFLRPLSGLARFLGVLMVAATPACRADEVTVLAAASLSDVLKETAPLFEKASGHTLRFNFGGSGTLARQIKEGAPADVFISADEARIDQLEKAGLLQTDSRCILLANTLVVVVAAEGGPGVQALADLGGPGIKRIVIGDPATVPAGSYARDHLQQAGLWEEISGKLLPVDSVRAALAAVEIGNADAGFVYRTDALVSRKVRIALEIPRDRGPRIVYPGAVLKDARCEAAARAYLEWITTEGAQRVFARHGFLRAQPWH